MNQSLISPYGGRLVDLLVAPEEQPAVIAEAQRYPSVQLPARALMISNIGNRAFSPLKRFMNKADTSGYCGDAPDRWHPVPHPLTLTITKTISNPR
jgi:sulfate adenylyltransferase